MSTTNKLTAPAQVAAPVTYAEIVKSAQTLNVNDIVDVKLFDKMPMHLQAMVQSDLTKRITLRKQLVLGETFTEIDNLVDKFGKDIIRQIREIMAGVNMTTVYIKLTADTFGIVKQHDKPTSTRSVGTGTKSSKYTYYLNDNMITGGSSEVATALGIDVTTDQYKKANGWLKIAVQAKSQGAIITRTNADNDTVEQFAPEATTKEAHAVWFAKQ